MIGYYNSYSSKDGAIYSCDMLRLKYEFKSEVLYNLSRDLQSLVYLVKYGVDCQLYTSFKASSYRDVFVYSVSDRFEDINLSYSFTIGVRHNSDTDQDALKGFIEFNPNKVNLDIIKMYMNIIYKYANKLVDWAFFEVVRYDIAIDIPLPRYCCKLVKEGKRVYKYIQSASLTEYLGVHNSDGFTKLYDKAYEQGYKDMDLTRLELTCTSLDTVTLPRLICTPLQSRMILNDDELTDTQRVLVELIREQEPHRQPYFLNQLGRKMREKLRKYIDVGADEFQYDKKGIVHVQEICRRACYMNF